MRNFQGLIFVLKRSCICYSIICMNVALIENQFEIEILFL